MHYKTTGTGFLWEGDDSLNRNEERIIIKRKKHSVDGSWLKQSGKDEKQSRKIKNAAGGGGVKLARTTKGIDIKEVLRREIQGLKV